MKDNSYYFKHDCNARQDEKLLALRMKLGWEGYGLYWALIEKLRESDNYSCVCDYNLIAYDLRSDANKIKSIIEDFRLFEFTTDDNQGKRLYSKRLLDDMHLKDNVRKARKEAGKKGGSIKQTESKTEANAKQTEANAKQMLSKTEANAKQNAYIKEEEKKKKKNIPSSDEEGGAGGQNGKRFTPPSVSQVREYIQEKGYILSADAFIDHYTSNGWMVGRNKMKDWKAAVRNWNSRQDEYARPNTSKNNNNNANDEW